MGYGNGSFNNKIKILKNKNKLSNIKDEKIYKVTLLINRNTKRNVNERKDSTERTSGKNVKVGYNYY